MPNPNLNDIFPVVNPVVARVLLILPPAGAYDAAPIEIPVAGIWFATFYLQYEQGAAGGAVSFYIETSPFAANQATYANWHRVPVYAPGVLAAGVDTASNIQREQIAYGSIAAAGVQAFSYGPIELGGTAERIRIVCAESGVTATPGVCGIIAVFA